MVIIMGIELWAIGGYNEIGRNMSAINVDGEVVILDMGVWLEKISGYENGDAMRLSANELLNMEAIPDDTIFEKAWGNKVKAILITHSHLDHVGACTKIAPKYDAPIIATPFTCEVLENLKREEKGITNKIIRLNAGSKYEISKNLLIEFVYATHSTPQTVIITLHTKYGAIVYANDFKFDEYPVLGKRTDYKRLVEIGKDGVIALISDSTRIDEEKRTFSESLVREMLKDVLLWTDNEKNAIITTTFASHIARLSTILNFAKEMGRKPVFIGRSLANYISAAERVGLVNFSKEAKIYGYKNEIKKALKEINKSREKYFIICTGNQGEPDAVLTRIAQGKLPFDILPEDQIVFCCNTIPSPINEANRANLERMLKSKRARIFTDIHASGHAAREDHRELLKMLEPKNYIPCHGGIQKQASAVELATEMGYTLGKDVHLLQNGQKLKII